MYDGLPNSSLPDLLDEVRCVFFDYGHDLSDALRLISGAQGEGWVITLALTLEDAITLDGGIRRELSALHALLALEHVQEGDPVEAFLLSGLGPASPVVETICLLTDLLEDLLSRIDAVLAETREPHNHLQTISPAKAA
jgi:hypothetical protein